MRYGLSLSARVSGTSTPVSLTEIKAHVRQDNDADDTVLADLVTAAAETYEDATGRVLQQGTYTMTFDRWPRNGIIEIPRWPLNSVTSITYLKEGEVSATALPSSLYVVDTARLPARIVLKNDNVWPTATLENGPSITVTFIAGYADGSVPEKAKHAVKLLVGHWYDNRESVVVGTVAATVPDAWRSLVLADRLW